MGFLCSSGAIEQTRAVLGPRAERLVGSNPTSSTMHLSHCLNPSLLKALLFDKKLIIIR